MALRIKSRWWNDEGERSTGEIASALAFIAWRIALDKAINLHCQRFVYKDDEQRLSVIQEYLIYLIQISDRLAYDRLDEEGRRELITEFVKRVARHVQDNSHDLLGPGDYGKAFIDRLNERSGDYAELQFADDGPSYPFMRHLGYEIQTIMGDQEDNRWVIDQVMDKDGWEAYQQLSKAFDNLFE